MRKGTCGVIKNVDGDRRAELFNGARACVVRRLYRPDTVVVELLDDAPGAPRGTVGELPLRYFIANRKRSKR